MSKFSKLKLYLRKGGKLMKNIDTKEQLKELLKQKVSKEEREVLKESGLKIKSPTKETMILFALYKKACSGDMNAIKEIRAMVSDKEINEEESQSGVVIINDI